MAICTGEINRFVRRGRHVLANVVLAHFGNAAVSVRVYAIIMAEQPMTRTYAHILTVLAVASCTTTAVDPAPSTPSAAQVISLGAIDTTADGTCFATSAAETETVTEDVVVEVVPAVKDRNGVVTSPAVFRNVTRPRTMITREGTRFETVCPPVLTVTFVTTLQRALQSRAAYSGPVNGQYDTATGLAVQRFQRDSGIDSPYLSVSTARQLGVLAVARDGT